ncbi:MAG: hypothetical protein ACI8P9_001999 [Parasphingorhabdus sp.]
MSDTDINSPSAFELGQQVSESTLILWRKSELSDQTQTMPTAGSHLELVDGTIPEHRIYQAESFHKLFNARTDIRREKLESLYNELGRPENIIVMMFCKNFAPLFENWLFSCEKHGIKPLEKLIVFCLDGVAARRLEELGVKCYFFNPEYYAPAGKSDRFGDEWFANTILYKNAVISEALTLGVSVLFQDADLIWFKDPFIYLDECRPHYDMQIMYDGPNRHGRPIYGNTGFIYLQSNDVTKALFETALRNSSSILRAGQHQFVFMKIVNFFLCHKLIRLHILPEHMFLNGHLFNLEHGVQAAARNWKEEGIVLHYSWTGTRLEKLQKLNKFRLNYSDIEETAVQVQPAKNQTQPISRQEKLFHYTVTLQLIDSDSIEVSCVENSPVLSSMLSSYFRSIKKGTQNEVIHLQLEDGVQLREVYLRTTQISRIEITPPLKEIELLRIVYADIHWLVKLPIRLRSLAGRVKRKLFRILRLAP